MTDDIARPAVRARAPRGFPDRGPREIAATEAMLRAIRESYALYGFEPVETPFFEYTEALGKFLPDQDRPNEGVFSLRDDDEQWLSLRYDLTAPLARYYAENAERLPKPYRSYRAGWVFRNEKPGPGRFRQFMQFDADTVGSSSPAADAEMCMMAADTLDRLGLSGHYVIKVNSRKILDGVMEAIGLGGEDKAAQRLAVLRSIDKLDRFGPEGVRLLLGPGRMDESGSFTKGAGLDEAAADALLGFLGFVRTEAGGEITWERPLAGYDEADNAQQIVWLEKTQASKSQLALEGTNELKLIAAMVAPYGDRIRIDPSVVRGLEYYTGAVYEAELTFEVKDEDGRPVRFGSVGGGGRYDGLVARFGGAPVPATGFSIGVSRLFAALQAIGSPIVTQAAAAGPVVVLALDRENLADYQALAKKLREANIPAEVYLGDSGMNAQLKYADRRGSICAIIQGSNERAKGVVAIKDLLAGAELAKSAKTLDRESYLALKARAQVEVPVAEMVAAAQTVLARHEPAKS